MKYKTHICQDYVNPACDPYGYKYEQGEWEESCKPSCAQCRAILRKEKKEYEEKISRMKEDHKKNIENLPVDSNDRYLIECAEHRGNSYSKLWWGPNRSGYTCDIDKAGRYCRDEALSIVKGLWDRSERVYAETQVLTGQVGTVQRVIL